MKAIPVKLSALAAELTSSKLDRLVLACLIVGSVFRLVWIQDMEWKGDEENLFHLSQEVCRTQGYPPVGIPSSKGFANPGLSVWILCAIGSVAHTPIAMVRWIQAANVIALWGFWFAFRMLIFSAMRPTYLMGLALFSVSPLPVLYSRKLWQQCLLAPFSLLFFLGFWFRKSLGGAFLLGAMSSVLFQIHMPAAYFVLGVAGLTLIKDGRARSLTWKMAGGVILGALVASPGLLPWVEHIRSQPLLIQVNSDPVWRSILKASFFWSWIGEAFGVQLTHSLQHMFIPDFAPLPRLFGAPTYGLLFVWLGCAVIGLGTLFEKFSKKAFWRDLFALTSQTDAEFFPKAIWLGFGSVLTLAASGMYPHYLIVAYPFVHVWAASLMADRRPRFFALIVLNFALTFSFLVYVHLAQGKAGGEYGVPYHLLPQSRELESVEGNSR